MSAAPIRKLPCELEKLLVELEYIAQFRSGVRVNIGSHSFSSGNTRWEGLKRFIYGESRNKLVCYLKEIADETISNLSDFEQTNQSLLRILISSATSAVIGIENSIKTYHDDPWYVAQVRVILKDLESKLNNFKELPSSS